MANLRVWAIAQMVTDLAALGASVHFTGGMQSPLLPFFAFHMAIGTIMIRTGLMYVLATATSLGVALLHGLEHGGLLPLHLLDPAAGTSTLVGGLNLVMLVVLMLGMVYLTDTVTRRFKERSIELHHASQELRHRSEELERSLEEKLELERRKSHYMRISAHQLRSPLGTVKTSLQVLIDGWVDPTTERGRRLLAGASERVDDLLAIVNDLLELAKMREGHTQAPWTRQVFLNQLLADIFDAMEPAATGRRIELVPDIEGAAVLRWGVPPDLVFAFENLVQNAIKYSRPGSEVRVRMRLFAGNARIQVIDQGIGIPAESLEDVFQEFVRAPNAKRFDNNGTGLGLSIVHEAITMHGGTVSVRSVVDEGTTFTVVLPLEHVPDEMRAHDQEQTGPRPRG
jgi:signal transduction histidine kinase